MESEVITKYNRETAEKTDRSGDAKFGHEDQAKGISFSPRYGNIIFLDGAQTNIEMGGEPFGVYSGKQRKHITQNIGLNVIN
jgi:hypothetical protein